MRKQYRAGLGWYGLFVGDELISDVEPQHLMSTRARELNSHARQIGVTGIRWMLLTDEDKEMLADKWMVVNFGEDGLH